MRSLKVIIFRDTDKPYTIILSSTLIVALVFSAVALVSLLTFSVLGNWMLLSPELAAGGGQLSAAAGDGRTGEAGEPAGENGGGEAAVEAGSQPDGAADAAGSENGEAVGSEQADGAGSEATGGLEDWVAPDSPFITIVQGEPAIVGGRIRYIVRVEKAESQLGINRSGRFIAALLGQDGSIAAVFPESVVFDGQTVANPERGIRFSISYRRDISIEFAAVDLEDCSALVLMVFESGDPNLLLWQKVESIR